MFYLRLYNKMKRWEDSFKLYASLPSPTLLLLSVFVPWMVLLLIEPALTSYLGLSTDEFYFLFIVVPAIVGGALMYFGEK